ncbi:MAG: phosphotransferase [Deltaproteobacteria bacterium]|nr:phosphotransferase [Deltaproteobacteria bacterium]
MQDVEMIEFDLLDQEELEAIKHSAQNLLNRIFTSKAADGTWNIRESIWPVIEIKKVGVQAGLVLLPLSRIGGSEGYGGGRVMIGYFVDCSKNERILPSRPMVVKITQPQLKANKLHDILESEQSAAMSIRPFVLNKDSFAIPLHFDGADNPDGYSVLWAPFSSSRWIWDHRRKSRLSLEIYDLWQLLKKEEDMDIQRVNFSTSGHDACKIISDVFKLLMPFHKGGKSDPVPPFKRYITQEYRNDLKRIEGPWVKKWKHIWGTEVEKYTNDLNVTWVNPFWVLEKIRLLPEVPLYCGAIHGDLHPKNIVLSENKLPFIIDFEFASDQSHITKDFVLMECNFRFVALSPNIPYETLATMSQWIGFDDTNIPDYDNEYCHQRIKLISTLREIARDTFPKETNWDIEYILPLFLTALSLLRFMSNFDNQTAARVCILSMANYLEAHILPGLESDPT